MKRTAALLLLLAGPAIGAGSWERMEMPNGVGYWEVDRASVTPTKDGTKRVLARLSYSGMQKDSAGNHWDHSVLIAEVDCEKRQWRVTDVVTYFRAERVEPYRTSSDWRPTAAVSVVQKAACG